MTPEAVIVRADRGRLDELEPLWEALRQHHHAVMPSLGALRERQDSWRRRHEHYERLLAEPGAFLLVVERPGGGPPLEERPGGGPPLEERPGGGPPLEERPGGGPAVDERPSRAPLLGYALVAAGSASQTWAIETSATLETIVLLPEARGQGLGSALVERVKEEVRSAGITHLGLGVVAGNEDAIRFYRRHGFEPAFVEMIARP